MLTEAQRKETWERWLLAETRAYYFADVSARTQRTNRNITWGLLFSSSGATVTLLSGGLPSTLSWAPAALALATTALSLWSLVAQHQQCSALCANLHEQWNGLASEYRKLWDSIERPDAADRLEQLIEQGQSFSKGAINLPYSRRLMKRWQIQVEREHGIAA